mmetsp:Transcript_128977/g.223797  ORF Transcript_128977/g.223797 Transcript_128977/m.223797 type:complete len:381 (-) Transcript_128977:218-1360(-)
MTVDRKAMQTAGVAVPTDKSAQTQVRVSCATPQQQAQSLGKVQEVVYDSDPEVCTELDPAGEPAYDQENQDPEALACGNRMSDIGNEPNNGAPRQVCAGAPPPVQVCAGAPPPVSSFSSISTESRLAPGLGDIAASGVRSSNVTAPPPPQAAPAPPPPAAPAGDKAPAEAPVAPFNSEETILIFDWDDTVLPSSWVAGQGLRLDDDSKLSGWHREQLSEVAQAAGETLRLAKQLGTVVLVTNAERGWIELSCQKFMPTLYPALESVKLLSARTTYESPELNSPLDWKLCAFESEITRVFGQDVISDLEMRKNVLSLGDSVHEREALLRATAPLPNCRSKSLKFVERPDISQICKQHSLITSCFDRIVHHDGNLDLCIRCA